MKSYFNVPDHINNTNRHLGIEKNVRKNKKEPKAKKKHRVARLKFLNNKRNIEIFQLSIDAMHEYITSLIEYYNNLRIEEEERILNLEAEKQRILEEAEIQKQIDLDNYNKFIVNIQKQLDLIPRYKAHIHKVIYENKLIEEEKKRLEELLLIEKNEKLLNKYKTYFDIINSKKLENIRLAEELENRTRLENEYKKYIKEKKLQENRYQKIYKDAIDINNKIVDDKVNMQKMLDIWGTHIESYNKYSELHEEYLQNLSDEQEALDHEKKINDFKKMFIELNNNVSVILQNINNNKNKLNAIDNEDIVEKNKLSVASVDINKVYTEHFEYALQNMAHLQKDRLEKINQLKIIEEEQKKLLAKKQLEDNNRIKKELEEFNRTLNVKKEEHKKYLEKQKKLHMKRNEEKKIAAKNDLERKAIKLKNDIQQFTESIENFNKYRDIAMREYEEKQHRIQIIKDNKIKEEQQRQLLIETRKKHIELFNNIEETVKEVQMKQIQEINDKYNAYQEEIIKLEKEKQESMKLEQEKTRKAIEKYNTRKQNLIDLENEYNEIILANKINEEKELLTKLEQEEKQKELVANFDQHFTQMKLAKIRAEEIKLQEEAEAIRLQEIKEYEEKLAFDNNIQYYSELIIDNQKQHEIFKTQLEEFKKNEIERLETIKRQEIQNHNEDIVGFSINHVLDLVDFEIETIEYNRTIEKYNNKIQNFHENINLKKLELEKLAQKKIEEEEDERLRLEKEELYLKELKKQQEEDMINQINDMLLEFHINTENHVKYIKLQKEQALQLELEKKEEERIRLLELERLEKEKEKQVLEYYKNHIDKCRESIYNYKEYIEQIEKDKIEKQKAYELSEKIRQEKYKEDLIQKHQILIDKHYKDVKDKKEHILLMQELQLEKERQAELKKRSIIENQKKEQEEMHNKYTEYFSDIIKNTRESYEKLQKDKEEARIQYEIQQQKILEETKKNKEQMFKLSLEKYKAFTEEIEKLKESEEIKLQKQKELEEEYEKEQARIDKQIREDIKKEYKNEIDRFHTILSDLEKHHEEEKIRSENEKMILEAKMLEEQKLLEENNKLLLSKLEEKFQNDIEIMNDNYTAYKEDLKKLEEEERLKLLQEEKIAREKYLKSINEYEDVIKSHNDYISLNKIKIQEAERKKEEDIVRIEKERELEYKKRKLETIKNYETEINNFYLNQKEVINKLQEELINEKEKEHNNRLLDIENEIRDKLKNVDKSEFLKKIDKTINFIKDISDNKENENYINDLKNQYDDSKIVNIDDTFVEDKDIISVTDDKLTFSDFDMYNKYMYNIVPKIIYQTWPTKNLTRNMAWVVNRIKTTHPDFEHHLYDDNDCRKFIREHFNMETLWAFDRLIPGAYKADLWRYCVLYITGGIYLDIKMCPVNGFRFDFLLKSDWFCNDIGLHPGIWQGILVSRPKNPIFKYLIDLVIENVKNEYYGDDPLEVTGPKMMRGLLNRLKVKVDTPLQIKKYLNKKASTLAKREYKVGICINGRECLLEYDEYRQECLRTGVHYNEAWKKNQIYDQRILLDNYLSNGTE